MNPSEARVVQEFRELFEREWYTNHGPLGRAFESRIEQLVSVNNAICVANHGIALTMALEVLSPHKRTTVRGILHPDLVCALEWSKANGDFADPDRNLIVVTGEDVLTLASTALEDDLGMTASWIVDATQSRDVAIIRILRQILSLNIEKRVQPILSVLSFQRGCVIEAQGAACILVQDDNVAEELRNLRSSYGVRSPTQVRRTANGRMSEAQAVFGLLSSEKYMKELE